ncbi:hypothetical protein ZEAMMB73_Zm00001d047777 [Zea mays]|nr:hypothetical protein ZEAMMB73_Zm00001d047777 [Zea mays]
MGLLFSYPQVSLDSCCSCPVLQRSSQEFWSMSANCLQKCALLGSTLQPPDLGSSFWGMVFILASTNLLTTRIAAGCFILALFIVLFVADNWFLRWLCLGFIVFIAVVWVIQEFTSFHILKYVILFIGVMNSLFSVYDIYDDLISRRVNTSDAEKFAEICPCPCNGFAWGVIWGFISFIFLCASIYLGLVILS